MIEILKIYHGSCRQYVHKHEGCGTNARIDESKNYQKQAYSYKSQRQFASTQRFRFLKILIFFKNISLKKSLNTNLIYSIEKGKNRVQSENTKNQNLVSKRVLYPITISKTQGRLITQSSANRQC